MKASSKKFDSRSVNQFQSTTSSGENSSKIQVQGKTVQKFKVRGKQFRNLRSGENSSQKRFQRKQFKNSIKGESSTEVQVEEKKVQKFKFNWKSVQKFKFS